MTPIEEAWAQYDLPLRVEHAFMRQKLTPSDVRRMTDADLAKVPKIGPKLIAVVRAAIPFESEEDGTPWIDNTTIVNGRSITEWRSIWAKVVQRPTREEKRVLQQFAERVDRALARVAVG